MKFGASDDRNADVDFTVIDADFDAAGQPSRPAAGAGSTPGGRAGRAIRLRWCAAALALALLTASAATGLYLHRLRPVTVTGLPGRSTGRATAALTGCPPGRECNFQQDASSELLVLAQQFFPGARQLQAAIVSDPETAIDYRASTVIRTPSGITVSILAEHSASDERVPAWQSPFPVTGPAAVVLVVPGSQPGYSVAVSAQVPAGLPVPAAALRQLAVDPDVQLQP